MHAATAAAELDVAVAAGVLVDGAAVVVAVPVGSTAVAVGAPVDGVAVALGELALELGPLEQALRSPRRAPEVRRVRLIFALMARMLVADQSCCGSRGRLDRYGRDQRMAALEVGLTPVTCTNQSRCRPAPG